MGPREKLMEALQLWEISKTTDIGNHLAECASKYLSSTRPEEPE